MGLRPANRFPLRFDHERGSEPVTLDGYNAYCRALPHASHVVQWGGAQVWKVGAKVFAICWDGAPVAKWATEGAEQEAGQPDLLVTFKCSPMSFDLLKEQPGLRPAPYLASRGLKWIQRTSAESMDDDALRDYLAESHRIVAAGLPKQTQLQLGLARAGTALKPLTKSTQSRDTREIRGGNE